MPSSSALGLGSRHRIGLVALAAAFAISGAGVLAAAKARANLDPARPAPFPLDSLTGVDAVGGPVKVAASDVGVVLYVSEACPYCAVELERWARTLASPTESTLPLVVLSPESRTDDLGYLPASLRNAWIHDASGDMARRLGVRAVPFHAVVNGVGNVVEVGTGLTPPDRIRDWTLGLPTQRGPDPGPER